LKNQKALLNLRFQKNKNDYRNGNYIKKKKIKKKDGADRASKSNQKIERQARYQKS
jgi:hypothetical protein